MTTYSVFYIVILGFYWHTQNQSTESTDYAVLGYKWQNEHCIHFI